MTAASPSLSGASGEQPRFIEPSMIRIPAQWFWMGCETGRDDEKPIHCVWVDSFDLAAHQVTNAEYRCFLVATSVATPPCWTDPNFNHPKMPVVAVSWHEATAYCQWLSKETNKNYRLPTEAEWECAARAGAEKSAYPWGEAPPESLPNYANRWKNGPEPVGLYPPNAYGLFNMSDNVHEWCADWYDAAHYKDAPERNPQGPADGVRKASRGGSWRHHIKASRNAARSSIPPGFQYADYGFRIASS